MVQEPVSSNEARVAGWGGRPAQWSASFGNDCGIVSWAAPVNLADDSAWCLAAMAGAVPGAQLIDWLLLWTGSCSAGGTDVDWLSALMGWHSGAVTQRAGVDRRALCMYRAAATPASECTFHRNYVCPSVPTQNGRDLGWQGGGR